MNPEKLKEKASPKGDKKAELAAALQKKKRRQKKRKHQIRAFLLMNKTGLIALLGISVVAGSYFTFEFFRPAPEEPGNQIVVSEETKKQDEEVDKFFVLFKGGVLRNKAARIEQLKQAVGLAEEIEANEFTSEKARNEVRLSKIDAAAELAIRAFESGMEEAHEFETNLEKMVSKELSNGGNGPAQQVAHLNITIYYILRHGSELSEKTCQRAIQQSQTSIPELVKSNTDLQRILKAGVR